MRRVLGGMAAILVFSAGLSGLALAQKIDRVEGEVWQTSEAEGKVTLRHGPLPNLDMPTMTMVLASMKPTMRKGIKVGEMVNHVTSSTKVVFYVLEITKP
ncbi:MAG: copper-binding protein [Alphaproteobacteria bacterium]|jgi:Cu(I)/Ag(I) efflux system periplasmic protein CusF|nr:copper-binding protein [Alphaproteobacteria bacterium]